MFKRVSTFVIGIVVGMMLATGIGYAVNFTVVLTQAQVDQATWKWNQVDPSHTLFSTVQLFGADRVGNLIAEWKNQRLAHRIQIYGLSTGYFCTNTWSGLSQGTKDGLCTADGDVAGCTICDAAGN